MVLTVLADVLLARLHARPLTPVTTVVSRIIEERGGDDLVVRGRQELLDLAADRGWAVVDATDRDTALAGSRRSTRRAGLEQRDPNVAGSGPSDTPGLFGS